MAPDAPPPPAHEYAPQPAKRTGLAALNRHGRRRIHALAVKHAKAQAKRDAADLASLWCIAP